MARSLLEAEAVDMQGPGESGSQRAPPSSDDHLVL